MKTHIMWSADQKKEIAYVRYDRDFTVLEIEIPCAVTGDWLMIPQSEYTEALWKKCQEEISALICEQEFRPIRMFPRKVMAHGII